MGEVVAALLLLLGLLLLLFVVMWRLLIGLSWITPVWGTSGKIAGDVLRVGDGLLLAKPGLIGLTLGLTLGLAVGVELGVEEGVVDGE